MLPVGRGEPESQGARDGPQGGPVVDRAAELLDEIARRPNDDHLLRVYADHLEELGDPRGELIALQLADADPQRVAELISAHGRAWVGPLLPWVRIQGCQFARGFLTEVALADPRSNFDKIIGNSIWATVRTIHLGQVRNLKAEVRPVMRRISALIAHPVMRSLQYVTESNESLMIERDPDGGCAFVPRFG